MEPISFVVGVVPLVAKCIKLANGYIKSVSNRRQTIASLIAELEALQGVMTSLTRFLQSRDTTSDQIDGEGPLQFENTSVLRSCCLACEARLEALASKLAGGDTKGRAAKFLWPLSEREVEQTIRELRSFTTWLQLGLSVDGCAVLAKTSDEVLQILKGQLEQFDTLREIHSQTSGLSNTIQNQTRLLEMARQDEQRRSLLNWLSSATHHRRTQERISDKRTEGTGTWLLELPEFCAWKGGVSESDNTLWLPGSQGSGKSNLVSVIVDDLQQSDLPLAYFYFDYQVSSDQAPTDVLRCILRQLAEHLNPLPKVLVDFHKTLTSKGSSVPISECERVLVTMARDLPALYIVLDALDECVDVEHRKDILQIINRVRVEPKIRILTTSRPHMADIKGVFSKYPQIHISAQDEDIKAYMNQEVQRYGVAELVSHEFLDKLAGMLCKQADGMFLLAVLQLRTVLQEPSLSDMEEALQRITQDLTAALQTTFDRIQNLPGTRSQIGMNALMWVSHTKRPMTMVELVDALAVRDNLTRANPAYRPFPGMVLECCQGFLVVEPQSQVVRPAHYTIQEFLRAHSDRLFPRAQVKMASVCLKYLLFDNFAEGPWDTEEEITDQVKSFPFLAYTSKFCGAHARPVEDEAEVWAALQAFFRSVHAGPVAKQVWSCHILRYRKIYWEPDECRSFTPFHAAANFGLDRSVRLFLEADTIDLDINAQTKTVGSTALIYAASANRVNVVKTLLAHDADPRISNWYGDAMHCSIEAGCNASIRELVTWGMTPLDVESYMYRVIDRDRGSTLECLVDLDVFPSTTQEQKKALQYHFDKILLRSAFRGRIRVVETLVRRGWADVKRKDRYDRNVIHYAAGHCDPAMLELLIRHGRGVDVNPVDPEGLTPLDYVLDAGYEASEKILREAGARTGEELRSHVTEDL